MSSLQPRLPAAGSTSLSANVEVGSVRLTIPLRITVSLGAATVVPPVLDAGGSPEAAGQALLESAAEFSVDSLAETEFTWRTALSLALASQLAYSPATVVESTAHSWGLTTCRFLESADTQCFVASTPVAVLVAFRGTESLGDWIADLNARRLARSYGSVHRGFYHAYNDVRVQLEQILASLAGRPIVLTGHSLGGALATVAAAEWPDSRNVAGIYTYGQPRVGNAAMRGYLNQRFGSSFSRFVNDDDIVPRLPPGLKHAGKLFHFDPAGNLQNATESALESTTSETTSTEPPPLTPAEFDDLRIRLLVARQRHSLENVTETPVAAPELEGLFPSFRDHGMDHYIRKISMHTP